MNLSLLKKIAIWIIGIIILIAGTTSASRDNFLGPLLVTLAGLIVLPPSFAVINSTVKKKLNSGLRLIIITVLIFIGMTIFPEEFNTGQKQVESILKESIEPEEVINPNVDSETAQEMAKVISVTDGDTLRVEINGENIPIRLIGIDTPEISHPSEPIQCYGPEAKQALEDLVLNKEVVLEKDSSDKDKYERFLRYIWLGEVMVNEYMTAAGFALASAYPPDTKYQDRISAGELSAKNDLKGLWAKETCNGDLYTGTYKDPNKVLDQQLTNVVTPAVIPLPTKSATSAPVYIAPVVSIPTKPPAVIQPASTNTTGYVCNCSKSCPSMANCEEAYFQLNDCGCSARDADDDGIPCESICN